MLMSSIQTKDMKKSLLTLSLFAVSVLFMLSSCVKDTCKQNQKLYIPVYKSLTEVRASIKSSTPQPVKSAGKIYLYGSYLFMNEPGKGIHVFNNSNPASPQAISFISIPGNIDLAVKGNYLYADCYSDIAVLDISNPNNVTAVKFMDDVIKGTQSWWFGSSNPDSIMVPISFIEKDTVVSCDVWNDWEMDGGIVQFNGGIQALTSAAMPAGKGGSMARFAIVSSMLYTVSFSNLQTIDISSPANPVEIGSQNMGWGIETIYPFKNKLFIGSTTGMFIYDITNPAAPVQQGMFAHARSCDPVVSDGNHAYVTLRSGTACNTGDNQLDVVDVTNVSAPSLVKTYQMKNPHGLGKDGKVLMVCDGSDGVKVYDATNPSGLQLLHTIDHKNAYDVIMHNGIAIIVAEDGLYQYTYTASGNTQFLSKINID